MGLKDLFKPRWQHSESHVRKEAVEGLTDQRILAQMARTDDDEEVRRAAVYKLTDQNVIGDIARNDINSDVRAAAVCNVASGITGGLCRGRSGIGLRQEIDSSR